MLVFFYGQVIGRVNPPYTEGMEKLQFRKNRPRNDL